LKRVLNLVQSQLLANYSVVNREFRVMADSRPERVGWIVGTKVGKALAREDSGAWRWKEEFVDEKGPLLFLRSPDHSEKPGRPRSFPDDLRETLPFSNNDFSLHPVGWFLLVFIRLPAFAVIVNPLNKLVQMSGEDPGRRFGFLERALREQ
jgi:hypothetical protein